MVGLVYADEPDHSYQRLCEVMDDIPFEVIIPMDENRAKDGLRLRDEYKAGSRRSGPCSFLEMLIALCDRMEYICGFDTAYWFYELLTNLQLDDLEDDVFDLRDGEYRVAKGVETVNKRTFGFNGYHGLFPLKMPKNNQKNAEIWYQMQAYLGENYDIT